jgi:hypothetical protein
MPPGTAAVRLADACQAVTSPETKVSICTLTRSPSQADR